MTYAKKWCKKKKKKKSGKEHACTDLIFFFIAGGGVFQASIVYARGVWGLITLFLQWELNGFDFYGSRLQY